MSKVTEGKKVKKIGTKGVSQVPNMTKVKEAITHINQIISQNKENELNLSDLGMKGYVYVPITYEGEGERVMSFSNPGEGRIYVNEPMDKKNAKFAIIYQVGHFLLHKDVLIDGETRDSYSTTLMMGSIKITGDNMLETEANCFALLYLIPTNSLKEFLSTFGNNNPDPKEIAKKFKVQPKVITARLKLLKLELETQ